MLKRWLYWCALHLWPLLPCDVQFLLSRVALAGSRWGVSRRYIPRYVRRNYPASYDWSRFAPASGAPFYRTFQDFFTRRLRTALAVTALVVWPCDGLLCDLQEMDDVELEDAGDGGGERLTSVKGDVRSLRSVFAPFGARIPAGYWFSNVFLHNRDYHRIHAPVSGTIVGVERIAGALRLLRPWAYKSGSPSLPAFTNERVNVVIADERGREWFLSIVGGPGVATIAMQPHIAPNVAVQVGEEIAAFALGSTCCVAGPERPRSTRGANVLVGTTFS